MHIVVTADPLDRHGALVTVNDRQYPVDEHQAQHLAVELVSAAEDLLYLANKPHGSDACEALRRLLPQLLRRET